MLDHFSISVIDYDKSIEFYDQTLGVLGFERIINIDIAEANVKCAGYGTKDNGRLRPYFWISSMGNEEETVGKARGVHIAFAAANEKAVIAWYEKCLKLGGKDNGGPGPRVEYHPGYYGAFIVDPDGWRIEACFHGHVPKL